MACKTFEAHGAKGGTIRSTGALLPGPTMRACLVCREPAETGNLGTMHNGSTCFKRQSPTNYNRKRPEKLLEDGVRCCGGCKGIEERGASEEPNAAPERYFENLARANLWKPRGSEDGELGHNRTTAQPTSTKHPTNYKQANH